MEYGPKWTLLPLDDPRRVRRPRCYEEIEGGTFQLMI